MGNFFLSLLSMSIKTSILIVFVMLFRLILPKAPKWIFPVLWGIVCLRLIIPYSITVNILPPMKSGGVLPVITDLQNNYLSSGQDLSLMEHTQHGITDIIGIIWIAGCIAMLGYMVLSYIKISFSVKDAVRIADNIYMSEHIKSAFVFGFIRPRILVNNMDNKTDIRNIISHEKAHIARADHILKPLAFILLSIYWFQPFIWIAYFFFNKDVELACDEKVVKNMNQFERTEYAQTLLNCSKREHSGVIPVQTFGGNNMKKRITFVIDFCKASKISLCVSISAMILVGLLSTVSLGATTKDSEGATDSEPPCISFAEFDETKLEEDEYLCCIDGVKFLLRIYNDNFYYTFSPSITHREMEMVADGMRKGLEKARKDIWTERTYTNKRTSIEYDKYQETKALDIFIESIVLR